MPSPKSGKAGTAISPAEPNPAEEADQADPGEVEKLKAEQRQAKSGKYGSVQTKSYQPPKTEQEKQEKQSWIAIELLDEEGNPVPGAEYSVTLPDGETVAEGTLDEKGFVLLDGIEQGTCQVRFPRLDGRDWKRK